MFQFPASPWVEGPPGSVPGGRSYSLSQNDDILLYSRPFWKMQDIVWGS